MPVGDLLEIRLISGAGVQLGLNLRHYSILSVVAPEPNRLQIASSVDALFRPLYAALLSTSASYLATAVRRVVPTPPSPDSIHSPGPTTGLIGGDPLPRVVSGIITLRTAFAGRRFRGRVYVPFPGEADNTSTQRPGPGYLTALGDLAQQLVQTITVTVGLGNVGLVPRIFHRRFGSSDEVISSTARAVWATQRRRGDYGRANLIPI